MPLPARLGADLLELFEPVAYYLHRYPQQPPYVHWLADRVCSKVRGLYKWAQVKDALEDVIPLTTEVEAFLDRGLLPSPMVTFEDVLADAARRIESVAVSGDTEFAHGRRAGLRAAAVRIRDWHRDSLLDKPTVPRPPATETLTKAARHVIVPDRNPVDKVQRALSALMDDGRPVDREVARLIVGRLPTAAEMLADRDELRRRLRRLWELEQTIRLDWDPTPERLRERAELAAEIDQLARTMAPAGAHGSSYGQGFAAGFGRAQGVLREMADDVRGVWLPGLTAEDVDFAGQ
ncbi:hypothetical protein [Kribbella italica]|uniref:Uncharacterized protein n=1 Tax=Kribbella italica TaxID=1540520 RepID=A0A7W9JD25_9ACTN|nr:hypothetical protein [Kribbella italica]MBB5839888.1 hypothetical protein [Kribbella italica]